MDNWAAQLFSLQKLSTARPQNLVEFKHWLSGVIYWWQKYLPPGKLGLPPSKRTKLFDCLAKVKSHANRVGIHLAEHSTPSSHDLDHVLCFLRDCLQSCDMVEHQNEQVARLIFRMLGSPDEVELTHQDQALLGLPNGKSAPANSQPKHDAPPVVEPAPGLTPAHKPKRSTVRGEGKAKLIAALTQHHRYAKGSCLNLEPIGNNELAKAAGVVPSTASAFFNDKFQGHAKYKALCRDASKLAAALRLLNDEFAPYHLLGNSSSELAAPEEEETDSE
jgi:hypothetical protein